MVIGLFLNACSEKSNREEESGKDGPQLVQLWIADEAFRSPETVVYDQKRDQFCVSNRNGDATDANGLGFITRMFADGKIDELDWVGGLDAPIGMAIYGDYLWVADIDKVFQLNILTAEPENTFRIEASQRLRQLIIDKEGTVFVNDMDHMVFRISEGIVSTVSDPEVDFNDQKTEDMAVPLKLNGVSDTEFIESKSLLLVATQDPDQIIAYKLVK
jgi:hypothetical protein